MRSRRYIIHRTDWATGGNLSEMGEAETHLKGALLDTFQKSIAAT